MTVGPTQRLLGLPRAFDLYQRVIGASKSKQQFVNGYVRVQPGDRVLDLGCGTGALLDAFPQGVEYVGVDIDRAYVQRARERFRGRGAFVCADVAVFRPSARFDVVVAYGLLHHLDDEHVRRVLEVARDALDKDGRAVFAEPCRTSGQRLFERALMNHDRGRYIRSVDRYVETIREFFAEVAADVVGGTYRIPFTLVVLEARSRANGQQQDLELQSRESE
jgi:cyclopropane fatty-acyl-phospholipid synthase-like methyltransferase